MRVEGDLALQPGKKYLFATNFNSEEGWYTVVTQPFGDLLVEGEARCRDLQERFEQAEEEQILLDSTP